MDMNNRKIFTELDLGPKDISQYLDLLEKAGLAMGSAYCRYSGFQVGAAVLTKDGNIITGCNVENASYGLTICAERAAIFKAVSEGCKPDDILAIAIAASAKNFSPCGACRQVIHEFGGEITVIFEYDGKIVLISARELLPYNFKI
jgi:cytidine deaminase